MPAAYGVTTAGALNIAAVNNTDALTAANASQVGATPAPSPTPSPTPSPSPSPSPTPTPSGSKVGIGAAVAITLVHAENDAELGGTPGSTASSGGAYQVGSLSVTALASDLGAGCSSLSHRPFCSHPAVPTLSALLRVVWRAVVKRSSEVTFTAEINLCRGPR